MINKYREYVRKSITKDQIGIEFGPGHAPLLPKADGYKVFSIDYETREDIIKRFMNNPLYSSETVEDVDAIDNGMDLREMFNCPEGFDYVVSAHNIEHIPDPIRFFQRVEKALKPDGRLYMLVPDRRYTFDYLRPTSTVGQIIEAYWQERKIHSVASLFDQQLYATVGNDPSGDCGFVYTFEDALANASKAFKGNDYTDTHGWVYTASSFRFIVSVLRRLGFIGMNVELVESSERDYIDFLVVMDKKQDANQVDFNDIAIQGVHETINPRRCTEKLGNLYQQLSLYQELSCIEIFKLGVNYNKLRRRFLRYSILSKLPFPVFRKKYTDKKYKLKSKLDQCDALLKAGSKHLK